MSRRGDEDFVAFVSASSPTLLHTAWLLCGDAAHAEDLVQEAFERVYLKWGRVSRDGAPLAYTRRVLVNLNTDRWRRTHRETVTDGVRESLEPTPAAAAMIVTRSPACCSRSPDASARSSCCVTTPTCPSRTSRAPSASASAP